MFFPASSSCPYCFLPCCTRVDISQHTSHLESNNHSVTRQPSSTWVRLLCSLGICNWSAAVGVYRHRQEACISSLAEGVPASHAGEQSVEKEQLSVEGRMARRAPWHSTQTTNFGGGGCCIVFFSFPRKTRWSPISPPSPSAIMLHSPSPLKTALAHECFPDQANSTLALPSDHKLKTRGTGKQRVQEQVMMTVKRQKQKSSLASSNAGQSNRGKCVPLPWKARAGPSGGCIGVRSFCGVHWTVSRGDSLSGLLDSVCRTLCHDTREGLQVLAAQASD